MKDKRGLHYDIEEKTNIISKALRQPGFNRPNARTIAEATDCFTFMMLDDLVQAFRKIAKGND